MNYLIYYCLYISAISLLLAFSLSNLSGGLHRFVFISLCLYLKSTLFLFITFFDYLILYFLFAFPMFYLNIEYLPFFLDLNTSCKSFYFRFDFVSAQLCIGLLLFSYLCLSFKGINLIEVHMIQFRDLFILWDFIPFYLIHSISFAKTFFTLLLWFCISFAWIVHFFLCALHKCICIFKRPWFLFYVKLSYFTDSKVLKKP